MTEPLRYNLQKLKAPVYSSLAMAFAGMGDAFLYAFLPLYAPAAGIPAVWVGILLSANRFARIAFSPLIVKFITAVGVRQATISAALLAVCSTAGYGLNLGLFAWLAFRIVWGLCFSVLRISTAYYALANHRKGLAVGLSNGLYEIGPVLALWTGLLLLLYFDTDYLFFVLATLSAVAFCFAFRLPAVYHVSGGEEKQPLRWPSLVNLLNFSNSFLAEGVFVVAIGVLIQKQYHLATLQATSFTAAFFLSRRMGSVLLSLVAGLMADYFGVRRLLTISLLLVSTGFVAVINGIFVLGTATIFCFTVVANALFPVAATEASKEALSAVAQNSVWRDAGAAFGTLAGGLFLLGFYLTSLLALLSSLQVVLVLIYFRKH